MPFTLAHPMAVILLARAPFILSALIVGSLIPDVEYFLRLAPVSLISHSWLGLPLFCLPVGLIVFWLWHRVLKRPLIELLPVTHFQRLLPLCEDRHFSTLKSFVWISFSLLLGAYTHLLWDSFTHSGGWAVDRVPVLGATLLQTPYGSLKLYKIFQHGSTLMGITLLTYLYIRWFRRAEPRENVFPSWSTPSRIRIIAFIFGSAGIAAACFAWSSSAPVHGFRAFRSFVVTGGIAGISGTAIASVVYSVVWLFGKRACWRRPL